MTQLPLSEDPRAVALAFVDANPALFRQDFRAWLEANWPIWIVFESEANRLWNRGRRHYSARTIIEWMRHETSIAEVRPSDFKINGNFVPYLARLHLVFHPERDGFFELRYDSDSRMWAA